MERALIRVRRAPHWRSGWAQATSCCLTVMSSRLCGIGAYITAVSAPRKSHSSICQANKRTNGRVQSLRDSNSACVVTASGAHSVHSSRPIGPSELARSRCYLGVFGHPVQRSSEPAQPDGGHCPCERCAGVKGNFPRCGEIIPERDGHNGGKGRDRAARRRGQAFVTATPRCFHPATFLLGLVRLGPGTRRHFGAACGAGRRHTSRRWCRSEYRFRPKITTRS